MNIKIRRLERGDTSVFVQHGELLDDPHAIVLIASDGDEEVGFVYEVDVVESHRREVSAGPGRGW
jgi:hypothetical protein